MEFEKCTIMPGFFADLVKYVKRTNLGSSNIPNPAHFA